jgi:hypothetical protein
MGQNQEPQADNFTFAGFQSPNFTQVPDEVFDQLLPRLSGAEMRVLLYIIRRTFGFKKQSDDISFNQICTGITTRDGKVLDGGTGLSKSTAQVAIKGLLSKQIIVAVRRTSAQRGNEPTTYALHFSTSSLQSSDPPYTENRHRGVPKIGIALYRKSASQYTDVQETDNNTYVDVGKNRPKAVDNSAVRSEPTPMAELISQRFNHVAEVSAPPPPTPSAPDPRTDDEAHEDDLIDELMDQLGDTNKRSRKAYRMILQALGSPITLRLLANTKEAYRDGVIRGGNRASYFIGMAKNEAQKQGVDLGFQKTHAAR